MAPLQGAEPPFRPRLSILVGEPGPLVPGYRLLPALRTLVVKNLPAITNTVITGVDEKTERGKGRKERDAKD